MRCDTVWKDARLATMTGDGLGIVEGGVVAAEADRIVYAGPERDAPVFDAGDVVRCEGRWITPGLIDPHTHLVYAGNRAEEFKRRLSGISYEEIAAGGGGILASVRETRRATETELVEAALVRLDALLAEGVTTVEIKSGYGLSLEHELKMLRAARTLGQRRDVRVRTTLLTAHAVAPEFAGDADGYIDLVCTEILPAAAEAGLADAVDVFCESIAFNVAQTRRVFEAARAHGLPVKIHAEQRTHSGGAALASTFGALSADHLEYLDEAGVAALAASGTVATLLPGAFYFLRETQRPPVASLLAAGVPIALGTDSNPGTSPLTSILLTMNMAATLFRMTVEQCLRGVTCNAARALGLADICGTLEAGKACDLVIWNIESPSELVYRMGFIPQHQRIWSGR